MEDITTLKSIMINAIKRLPVENYSEGQTSEAIRNALIELNGGSTKLNHKTFYRGSQLFALVEEIIPTIIDEGFKDDDLLAGLIDYRNIPAGDEQSFEIEANSLVVVADSADGVRGIRRQRIDNRDTLTVPTVMKTCRVYEDLSRLLAGKIDFNTLIDNVAKAYKEKVYQDAYAALQAISKDTLGLGSEYNKGGSYNEDELLDLIEHVEAATGKKARIYGTKTALRKIDLKDVSDHGKEDKYMLGYYGMFNGTEIIAMRQAHIPGTNKFALDNTKLYVIADGDKPIKVVNEGDSILSERDPFQNNDLTQEYFYGQSMGVAVVCAQKLGVYTLS